MRDDKNPENELNESEEALLDSIQEQEILQSGDVVKEGD